MKKLKSSLFDIAKEVLFFQDAMSYLSILMPPVVEHNLSKHSVIKKAFYMTAMDQTHGDYYEFGIFTGSSFVCAMRAYSKMKNLSESETTFFGFDSFQGFGDIKEDDSHIFFQNSMFSLPNKKKILDFIKKRSKNNHYQVVEGFFDDTLKGKSCAGLSQRKARIVFIDCDLKELAILALEYIKDGLQEGTILILDDFYLFKGSHEKGIAGAFYWFANQYPHITFSKILDYGYGSAAFIVTKIAS
jgi:hypothetical protein